MSQPAGKELPSIYNPHGLQAKWYPIWENGGYFSWKHGESNSGNILHTSQKRQPNFSIVIPPPNVTGSLHLGHALNHTIMDILARFHRMKQFATLWIPGTDHAGIATQNVVERMLSAEGKGRKELGRQKFEEKVWEWKAESGGMITHQQRELGESVDWDYERFTMDEGLSFCVRRVFKRLYDEGLIYRGERMINWCPKDATALSNIEVEYRESHGKLIYVKYPLRNDGTFHDEYLLVATTRPETIPGDEALAVHPDDSRYTHLIGKKAVVPVLNREIPIIADTYVDKEFGSGVVKITPAHDPNDFQVAQRHDLPLTNIMTDTAHMNEKAGPYKGLSREECRKKILADMTNLEIIEKSEDIKHSVGHSYRSGAVVEPRLSTQWFVKVQPLAQKAKKAVKEGRTRFVPQRWENLYFEWLENIEDWCISRQLWWGHRIPAWHCTECGHTTVSEANINICEGCKSPKINRDEDVLDTWFSSGLWPFSTMLGRTVEEVQTQWVGKKPDSEEIRNFYPTSVLVTGFDIIFFWVARMMMFALHFMDEVPFREVYMHGLVRDAQRQKMSKSKGNVVNPLEKMEEYGTDAFRFFLMSILPEGKDIIFDESRLKGYQAFCNKIWNTARYIWMNQPSEYEKPDFKKLSFSPTDFWILCEFNKTADKCTSALENYRFAEYTQIMYDFIWKTFCDYYIEFAKISLKNEKTAEAARFTLNHIFEKTLQLLHPVMPFITEELYSYWPRDNESDLIIISRWPQNELVVNQILANEKNNKVTLLIELITMIRRIRGELSIPPSEKIPALLELNSESEKGFFEEHLAHLITITRLSSLEIVLKGKNQEGIKGALTFGNIWLNLKDKIDTEKELQRIQKEISSLEKGLSAVNNKLKNPQFAEKAPAELVQEELEKKKTYEAKVHELQELQQMLGG